MPMLQELCQVIAELCQVIKNSLISGVLGLSGIMSSFFIYSSVDKNYVKFFIYSQVNKNYVKFFLNLLFCCGNPLPPDIL